LAIIKVGRESCPDIRRSASQKIPQPAEPVQQERGLVFVPVFLTKFSCFFEFRQEKQLQKCRGGPLAREPGVAPEGIGYEVPVATRRTPFNNNTIVMAKIKVLTVSFQKSLLRKEI
jgi:hypothetical protein